MISIVIPTLNATATLPATFASLVEATVEGVVKEVVVADGGSTDETLVIADGMGAAVISTEKGRGRQLRAGAEHAKADWLLFLHADTVLDPGWHREVDALLQAIEAGKTRSGVPADGNFVAAFRFALDDLSLKARLLERLVGLRCRLFKLPYGDQAFLVSREFYDELGGFEPVDLMEDVKFVRRAGWRRVVLLQSKAITSAERFKRGGYIVRPLKNLSILCLYFLRVPTRVLNRLYG